jgi:arginase family enzyme
VVDIRILDLDGSLRQQPLLVERCGRALYDFHRWGPRLRMACGFGKFERFERALRTALGPPAEQGPALTFVGSGDFHHVTLALLRRLERPFNLLVLDKHPDWMRGVPILHCGTWLHHAARLPQLKRIFHVGGDVDFDNGFRWLAPWRWLRQGKIHVIPAVRRFRRGRWNQLVLPALRSDPAAPVGSARVEALMLPHLEDLNRYPLYISLDKDVLVARHALVNWDSGFLGLGEVEIVLRAFIKAAGGDLAGMDVVGDWSAVKVRGLGRRLLSWTEHPRLEVPPGEAARCNQRTNLELLARLGQELGLVDSVPTGQHLRTTPTRTPRI